MSDAASETASSDPFELKASAITVPVMKLFDPDMDRITDLMTTKIEQAPDFFHNAPIVIDLSALKSGDATVDFALLVGLIRGMGMIPVGVQGGNELQNEAAEMLELAILSNSAGRPRPRPKARAAAAAGAAPEEHSLLVTRPVRSGQRLYARGGDLVVTAAVSSGAELFADGNIHVYGALRGRALAGVKGDTSARIFCRKLNAELVSIAGRYKVSDSISREHWGDAVQVYLIENRLVVEPI